MARTAIFPLVFKPGINRDLTPFESESCVDGFWTRWYSGRARAMGGQLGALYVTNGGLDFKDKAVIEPLFTPINSQGDQINDIMYAAVSDNSGQPASIFTTQFSYNRVAQNLTITRTAATNNDVLALSPLQRFMGTFAIQNGKTIPVFLATNNYQDITDNSPPALFIQDLSDPASTPLTAPFIKVNNVVAGIDPKSNGGLCWAAPYLFIYGSGGIVQYSANNDITNFNVPVAPNRATFFAQAPAVPDPLPAASSPAEQQAHGLREQAFATQMDAYNAAKATAGGTLFLPGGDKVIYGSSVRGGSNSPSVLFWTTSKVCLISNIGEEVANFRIETLSKNSSILSSRCCVEVDGLFFWPGTSRFFVYNGIVGEMVNDMSRQYFFSNIDMTRRQEVFGLYNERFGEIWWFYVDLTGIRRAIIYNKTTNTWYDTRVSRIAGRYYNERGYFITIGEPLIPSDIPDTNTYNYVWLHTENNIVIDQGYYPNMNADALLRQPIQSTLTTPFVSMAAATLNPAAGGMDAMAIIKHFEPDIRINAGSIAQEMTLGVYGSTYAQSTPTLIRNETFKGAPGPFVREEMKGIVPSEKIDLDAQATNVQFTLGGSAKWQMGKNLLTLSIGDKQRTTTNS